MVHSIRVGKYIEQYLKEDSGKSWIQFWDYINTYNKRPIAYSETNIYNTLFNLYIYLVNFGMARGPLVRWMEADKFKELILGYNAIFEDSGYYELQLDSPQQVLKNQKEIDSTFEQIYQRTVATFKDHQGYDFTLFISKTVMAMTGQCVAYDTYFNAVYKMIFDYSPLRKTSPEKKENTDSIIFCNCLEKHSDEIDTLDSSLKITPNGNAIPKLRLIDMAYWYYYHREILRIND